MPLVRSFALSTKQGKEAWAEPIVDRGAKTVQFKVRTGKGEPHEGTVNRRGATCIVCGTVVTFDHIRSEGRAGCMDAQLMAIVADGRRERLYLSPDREHIAVAAVAKPPWKPEAALPDNTRDIRPQLYGMPSYGDLFTPRQLVALSTLGDLVGEAWERGRQDAVAAGLADDEVGLSGGGTGARAYADAVATYLGEAASKMAVFHNNLAY